MIIQGLVQPAVSLSCLGSAVLFLNVCIYLEQFISNVQSENGGSIMDFFKMNF